MPAIPGHLLCPFQSGVGLRELIFFCGKVPLGGRLLVLPLLLWGMLDLGSGRPRCKVRESPGGDMNMHRSRRK